MRTMDTKCFRVISLLQAVTHGRFFCTPAIVARICLNRRFQIGNAGVSIAASRKSMSPSDGPQVDGPLASYHKRIASGTLEPDSAQERAAARLDALWRELAAQPPQPGFFGRLFGEKRHSPRGLYLWGPVGRG